EMRELENEQRIRRNQMEDEMRRNQDLSREEEERLRMEADREMEREREEMNRRIREQEMELERERLRMNQEMMDEQMRMEQERMEQQREMMKNMDGAGGRDDFFQPEEKCFVEDEEDSRGLFGNISIGTEIDCEPGQGMEKRLQDPTTLAMIGLVVTVGATMLQMFRGN
ncbi:MAG: hypothetical protein VYA06_02760, partial [Chloroflexota bacterium]|nr:hypothetical protein [Chloroflexota bacterium]